LKKPSAYQVDPLLTSEKQKPLSLLGPLTEGLSKGLTFNVVDVVAMGDESNPSNYRLSAERTITRDRIKGA
jgi:hypothetical protein